MSAPTANDDGAAIAFGQRIVALLDTGSFRASYKYAVLLAVLDAVLEGTDEQGRPPTVLYGRDIGRRVLELYWPQARPFTDEGPLAQSPQRDLVRKIAEFRVAHRVPEHATVERVRRQHPDAFAVLERTAIATVVRYPIPLLQRIGVGGRAVERPFIYTYGWRVGVAASTVHADGFDDRMHLIDNAGEHLAALAGLLRPVIAREWLQFVAARNDADVEELRLQQFLFGSERIGLGVLVEPLQAIPGGRCFYCDAPAAGRWEIDPLVLSLTLDSQRPAGPACRTTSRSLGPRNACRPGFAGRKQVDNLVLVHARCNNDKRAAVKLDCHWGCGAVHQAVGKASRLR